jgi:hypothetical protein
MATELRLDINVAQMLTDHITQKHDINTWINAVGSAISFPCRELLPSEKSTGLVTRNNFIYIKYFVEYVEISYRATVHNHPEITTKNSTHYMVRRMPPLNDPRHIEVFDKNLAEYIAIVRNVPNIPHAPAT